MDYSLDLLSEILVAQGMPKDRARKAAEVVLSAEIAAGITTAKVIESVNRDAHIYKLRGMRLTSVVIGERMGLCRATIFSAIHRHAKARRSVLRLSAIA